MDMQLRHRSFDPIGLLVGILILAVGVILVLVGRDLDETFGPLLKEAGIVLIGTVLVTYVYEFVLKRQHDRYVMKLVEESLVANGPRFGLTKIEARLSFQKLFEKLDSGDELLWLDTYCPDQANFQEALRVAVDRGASVRMLALDPDSDNAEQRAKEIKRSYGYDVDRFRTESRTQLKNLRGVLSETRASARDRVEVRMYDDLPCIPMYIHVRSGKPLVAFTSFYLGAPTFSEPHLKWEGTPQGFLQHFYSYFEAKWLEHEGASEDLEIPVDKKSVSD